jgi:DNA-binding transcriptional MerR regulator
MTHSTRYTLIRHCEGVTGEARSFDLDTTAELTGVHRDLILEFTRAEFLPTVRRGDDESILQFDEHAIYRLRQIESLRQRHHTSLRVIRDILRLLDRLEDAELEVRRLREQLR